MNSVVYALVVFGSEKLGDDHARAGAQTGEHSDHQVDNRRARTHRCQRIGSDVVADHDGVDRVVKLLEQIAQQQRQRKQQQLLPDNSLGHQTSVFLHSTTLF